VRSARRRMIRPSRTGIGLYADSVGMGSRGPAPPIRAALRRAASGPNVRKHLELRFVRG